MVSTAVDPSAVARVLGIKTDFVNLRPGIAFLPQRIAVIAQGNSATVYDTTKRRVTSAFQAGSLYGFGSPIHLAVSQLLPATGGGVGSIPVTVYPLEDAVAGVTAAGTITPSGAAGVTSTHRILINNIASVQFTIEDGDTVADIIAKITAAINANPNVPVIATAGATNVAITAKWDGETGNDIVLEVEDAADSDVTFAIVQPTGGAANPDITPALNQIGDVWETLVLLGTNYDDTTNLDRMQTFGDGRWGALVRKPLVSFVGSTETSVTTAISVTDTRKDDRVNAQLVAPGSNDHPISVSARQLAVLAVVANSNPPRDYGSKPATGLTPGADGSQWTFTQRDQAVKGGSSTIEVKDGVVNLSDIVTMYHPSGDPTPAYRYVVDIVKLQNIIFNLDLIFATADWDGAPLIPDDQPTVNPEAKKPKTAKAAAANLIDSLALNAIISDPETAKDALQAEIDAANPKRLNLAMTVQLSGNTNIRSIDLNFGFFFGTSEVVA